MSESITNLADAVAVLGALPMPVGPAPQKSRTMLDRGREALSARMSKDDLRLVLDNVLTYTASLEARVAALEAERHVTNEALSDAAVALRADRQRIAELEGLLPGKAEAAADKLTRLFAPVAALREDLHDGPLTHSYRVPRDLPETGGA